MWDRVQIVRIVIIVGTPHIHRRLLQLDKEERNTVHEPDNIRPPAVDVPVNPQLLDGEKGIVLRIVEVDHRSAFRLRLPIRFLHRDGDAVADEEILLLIHLQERCGR